MIYGSSPRTRGTHAADNRRAPRAAVHPRARGEHAEKRANAALIAAVHPRARGEHAGAGAAGAVATGSSPRTRGTRKLLKKQRFPWRFIPAHAGNTTWPRTCRSPASVHPRARGEHAPATGALVSAIGSSPRTRGTLWTGAVFGERSRFIPAHAGNTRAVLSSPKNSSGSSPRTRGTRQRCIAKTERTAVHPRARGEHRRFRQFGQDSDGSSPRTRGTHTG